MRRNSLVLLIAAIMLAGMTLVSLSGASYADKIVQGVRVETVELGGMTRDQAKAALTNLARDIERESLTLRSLDQTWQAAAGELGVRLDYETTLDQALQIGHTGSLINQWRERHEVKTSGLELEPVLEVDQAKLERRLTALAGDVVVEPENAGFKITPDDQVELVPEKVGVKIDFASLAKILTERVSNRGTGAEAELPLVNVTPQRTLDDIKQMGVNGLIASYSTNFDPSQVGRTYNIKVAAAALHGLLLAPGDEFSFNRVVGPRSSEAGYKNANVIINNELVQGLGGGVCQVSSTLYNAVLLANLKITERSNHSLPIGYVPIGRDATVVYDAIDFRFANSYDSYIYVKSVVSGATITCKIYGDRTAAPKVELASWVTEEIEPKVVYEKDPNLAAGEQVVKQKGSKGFKVATARTVWQNGEKTTENLPISYYHVVNRVVALGTGAVKPTVVVPTDSQLSPSNSGQVNTPSSPMPSPGTVETPGTELDDLDNDDNIDVLDKESTEGLPQPPAPGAEPGANQTNSEGGSQGNAQPENGAVNEGNPAGGVLE